MKVIVNGKPVEVSGSNLSFTEVVELANESPYASVTYCRAAGLKSEGIMGLGDVVEVQEGTIFSAIVTGAA